jgi:hypothetical protein
MTMTRLFIVPLIIGLLLVPLVPGGGTAAHAMLAPDTDTASAPAMDRARDLQTVQRVLESKVVQQRLADIGLSPQEANAKLQGLSDAQVHQLASQIESLVPAGFHGVDDIMHGVLAAVLVVILIVGLVIGLSFL